MPRTIDDDFADIAALAPGFGGLHLDQAGALVVSSTGLSDSAQLVDAIRAVAPTLMEPSPGTEAAVIRLRPVDYDFVALRRWGDALKSRGLPGGTTLFDIDELANRLYLGGADATAVAALTAQTDAAGIPREATVIEQIPPAVPDITLQDRHRPIPAGVTIEREDTGGDCTINVNANTQEMGPGLITSSHCSYRFGNEGDGTRFHQNVISNFVAVEFADPPIIACFWPDGCRFSDAAFAGYASTSLPFHGTIARTNGPWKPWRPNGQSEHSAILLE